MSIHTELRLAQAPCTARCEENGYLIGCYEIWRKVRIDDQGHRMGSIKCLHGHEVTGKAARLVHPIRRGR